MTGFVLTQDSVHIERRELSIYTVSQKKTVKIVFVLTLSNFH